MVACRGREEGARWWAAGHMVRISEGGNALWETEPAGIAEAVEHLR